MLGAAVPNKQGKKIAAKDADQYMLRLPPGLRDKVAARAAENGRSMNTEIIDAIEKHLKDADRITLLWGLFEKHREDLEAIPYIWGAVEYLENEVGKVTGQENWPLTRWREEKEEKARQPAPPPKSADQGSMRRRKLEEELAALRAHARDLEERIRAIEPEKQRDPPA
jgi:hypothetical protein